MKRVWLVTLVVLVVVIVLALLGMSKRASYSPPSLELSEMQQRSLDIAIKSGELTSEQSDRISDYSASMSSGSTGLWIDDKERKRVIACMDSRDKCIEGCWTLPEDQWSLCHSGCWSDFSKCLEGSPSSS